MTAGISCRRLKDSILVDNESGNSPFWLAWLFPCTCRRCLGTDRVSFDRSQNRHVRYPRKQAPGGLPRRLRTRWPWPGSRPSSRSRSSSQSASFSSFSPPPYGRTTSRCSSLPPTSWPRYRTGSAGDSRIRMTLSTLLEVL